MFVITNRFVMTIWMQSWLACWGGGGGGCFEHQICNLGIGLGKSDSGNWGKPERAPHWCDCIEHACLYVCLLACLLGPTTYHKF